MMSGCIVVNCKGTIALTIPENFVVRRTEPLKVLEAGGFVNLGCFYVVRCSVISRCAYLVAATE